MRLSGRKSLPRTHRWKERQQIVLLTLLSVNAAVFVAQLSIEIFQPGFVRAYLGISDVGVSDAYAWQFITAIFLHQGPWHFVGNMLVFFLLSRDIETILGQRHFLYLYLAGAVGGELGHLFLMPANTVLYAASGGVAAVVIAYATILPEMELAALGFFKFPLRLKAKHLTYAAMALALILICVDRTGVVSHSAYLGGLAAGWLYAHLLGFGRPSILQRYLSHRRAEAQRYEQLTIAQLIAEEIDPLLEKISDRGYAGLTKNERKSLLRARDGILRKSVE